MDQGQIQDLSASAGADFNRALVSARLKGGVLVVDRNLRVVMIDRTAAAFCGVSPGQSQNKRFYALFPGLLGSAFATVLHDAVSQVGRSRFGRPADNDLLDQFEQAFPADELRTQLLGLSLECYRGNHGVYALVQLNLQKFSGREKPAIVSPDGDKAPLTFLPDPNTPFLVVDNYGFILDVSLLMESIFGYGAELLQGSSVRILFPGLDDMGGEDVLGAIGTLSSRHPLGYLEGASSMGDQLFVEVNCYRAASGNNEIVMICSDRTDSGEEVSRDAARGHLFDLVARSVADGVMLVDAEGFVKELNPVAEQLLGFKLSSMGLVQAQTLLPLVSEETGLYVTPVEDALYNGVNIEANQHLVLKMRGESPMSLALSAFPVRNAMGKLDGCLVVFRPLSEARRVSSRLSWQATHDALTGLPNRALLSKHLQQAMDSARDEGVLHSLLYIDLYNFSVINDTCGHRAGDQLLKEVGRLLLDEVDASDIVARIGNDEFAVLLHNASYDKSLGFARFVLDRLKKLAIPWEDEILRIGASIGGTQIDSDAVSDIDLMIAAGSSCATARDKGRNKVHFQSFNEEVSRRRALATVMPKIVSALDDDRFTLLAQPIQPLNEDGENDGYYEVLVRMIELDGRQVSPLDFIPAAEHFSLIDDVDKWVFLNSLKYLQRLRFNGVTHLPRLSVNLSGVTIGDETTIDFLISSFAESGISPEQIQFEITETAAVRHFDGAKRLIARLRDAGASFALDDFGSGLSSFAYLKELPVDCLKIDASFIRSMAENDVDRSVVSTINHLGHVMGIKTVAEGVETEEQLAIVRDMGIDFVQGYLIQSPQPLDLIVRRLSR